MDYDDAWTMLLDDFPDGLAPSPQLAMMMLRTDPVPMTTQANDLRPTEPAMALKPGDKVLVAMTEALVNNEIATGTVLDPEQYAERFPNWEERVHKSWMLLEWISTDDFKDGPHIGWFEWSRMIPMTEEQQTELVGYFPEWEPEEEVMIPSWIQDLQHGHVRLLSHEDPSKVSTPVTCGECGSSEVMIHGIQVHEISAEAAQRVIDGKTHYYNTGEIEHQNRQLVHLHCTDCNSKMDLDDDEYHFHS